MTAHPRRESRDPAKRNGFAGWHRWASANEFKVWFSDLTENRPTGWYWAHSAVPTFGPFRSSRAAYLAAIRS